MLKKTSILFVVLLILFPMVKPMGDDDECFCNSYETVAVLDAVCKFFCKEIFAQGTCVGWSMQEGKCKPSGSMCDIQWKIICKDGSSKLYDTSDPCGQCPFFEDPKDWADRTNQN